MPKFMTIVRGPENHSPPPPALFQGIENLMEEAGNRLVGVCSLLKSDKGAIALPPRVPRPGACPAKELALGRPCQTGTASLAQPSYVLMPHPTSACASRYQPLAFTNPSVGGPVRVLPAALAFLATALLAPGTLPAQVRASPDTLSQVAAAGDTLQVVYWTHAPTPRLHQVIAHNRTDRPLLIRGYRLSACTGVPLPTCRYHETRLLLAGHETAQVGQVATRQDIRGGFRYRVTLDVDVSHGTF